MIQNTHTHIHTLHFMLTVFPFITNVYSSEKLFSIHLRLLVVENRSRRKILITCSRNKYRVKYSFAGEINMSALIFIDGNFRFDPRHSDVHNDGIVSRVEETCCASFCEVLLKDIGPPDLTPLFSDSLAGVSAERVRQELESSFCRALAETFIGISSANTASALRAHSAPNSYLLHLRAVEMINNRLSSAQSLASAITTSVI